MAADDKRPDPFEAWRDWLDQAERRWNSTLAEAMESDQFSKTSGRMMELFVGFQSAMNDATNRYFTALNMPTRTDVLSLGERLSAIEERLQSLERAVSGRESLDAASRPRQAPRRTRRPPVRPAADAAESSSAGKKASTKKKATRRKSRAATRSKG